MIHCKRCDNQGFRTISSLRKHQWAAHRDFYRNTGKRMDLVKIEPAPPMTAAQLLDAIKGQQTFINDVVTLVEGLIK